MKRMWMLSVMLAASLALASEPKKGMIVREAWVREPNPAVPITAAFLTLENPTDRQIALVDAKYDGAEVVEIHEMKTEGGVMSMRKAEKIPVPPKGVVKLEPGGAHIMLIRLTKELHDGDKIEIGLEFDDGTSAKAGAVVRKPEAAR